MLLCRQPIVCCPTNGGDEPALGLPFGDAYTSQLKIFFRANKLLSTTTDQEEVSAW